MAVGRDVTLLFPEIILMWEQRHGLQQPLAKSHNLTHLLPLLKAKPIYTALCYRAFLILSFSFPFPFL